ncbi:MAG: fluoride efflux transporter CrcB [Thermodesulfobacteriota bacterium]|nr:fluoride efflux transporter CrcB [Thermodesulfobacteriota bacterium]
MNKILMVGIGGCGGALLRYFISGYVQKLTGSITFPYGTLTVNLIGCLLIGMCSQLDETRNIFSGELRLFLFIGLFGAFTTYSTFSNETMNLINDNNLCLAFTNVTVHTVFGLLAVWIGRMAVALIWR